MIATIIDFILVFFTLFLIGVVGYEVLNYMINER